MANTVIGVFDNYTQAQSALNDLLASGISRGDMQLGPAENTPAARQSSLRTTARTDDKSAGDWSIGNFFRSLFGADEKSDHADVYSEAVRRGSYLLIVDVATDDTRDRATDIMNRYDPIDIDERASQWRSQGWSKYDESAPLLSDAEIQQDRSAYATSAASRQTAQGQQAQSATTEGEARIPVVEEQLKIGKREVQRGGVRVFQRVVETPVEESVRLREEQVKVERRPVDQPAAEADMAAFKEGSVEVRETAEEPVVEKTARVVEEVVVAKEVSEKSETVSDTVRRTDVEVEKLGAQAGAGVDTAATDNSEYRSHWQSTYGDKGGKYEDYASAYRYGGTLGGDERYKGYRWADLEPEARRDWEAKNAGSPWEKFKDAIRHSWEKVTGKK